MDQIAYQTDAGHGRIADYLPGSFAPNSLPTVGPPLHQLNQNVTTIRWSPDGKSLKLDLDPPAGDISIAVCNPDFSDIRYLTSVAFRDDDADWGP